MSADTPILVTGDLCDLHKSDVHGTFRVLPPVFRDYGKRTRFAGRVVTLSAMFDLMLAGHSTETPMP